MFKKWVQAGKRDLFFNDWSFPHQTKLYSDSTLFEVENYQKSCHEKLDLCQNKFKRKTASKNGKWLGLELVRVKVRVVLFIFCRVRICYLFFSRTIIHWENAGQSWISRKLAWIWSKKWSDSPSSLPVCSNQAKLHCVQSDRSQSVTFLFQPIQVRWYLKTYSTNWWP